MCSSTILLFRSKINESKTDDMGWPSCLYNVEPQDQDPLIPVPSPVPGISALFGACDKKVIKRLNPPLLKLREHVSANGLTFAPKNFARGYEGDCIVAEFPSPIQRQDLR